MMDQRMSRQEAADPPLTLNSILFKELPTLEFLVPIVELIKKAEQAENTE